MQTFADSNDFFRLPSFHSKLSIREHWVSFEEDTLNRMRGWPIISAIERAEEEKGFAQYERQNHIRAHRTNPGEIQNVRPLST